MTTVLTVTSNPQTFSANTWNGAGVAMNVGSWRFTFTPTAASTTFTGGTFHALFGQNVGGIWLNDTKLELYTTPADGLVFSQPLTWLAATTIAVVINTRPGAGTVTISGALTGNGAFSFTPSGPYFDPTLALDVGNFGGAFTFAGTVSSIDDMSPDASWSPRIPEVPIRRTASSALLIAALVAPPVIPPAAAPPLSWAPSVPDYQLRAAARPLNVGGQAAPEAVILAPGAPAMSWVPAFPDLVPSARRPINEVGIAGPVTVIVNAPAPLLSWAPAFPDLAPRARAEVLVGGQSGPEAVIPTPPTPGISWLPQYPDLINRQRHPVHAAAGMTAPPFGGGRSLTTGVAAVRQNILSQLAASSPLTTFGTDLTFTASGNTLTTGTHGMIVTAGPFQLGTTGTLPAGSDSSTFYYMITPSTSTVHLALTPALAKAGTAVTLTDAGTGVHTLIRAVNTAPLYSTLLAIFGRGTQSASPNQATDSAGNAYSYIPSAPRPYDSFTTSSFSISTSFGSKGGNAHTWSASIGSVGGQQDEVVIAGLEIFNGRILQSSSVLEIADGSQSTITSGAVTTTAKALLVAVVAGNGNVNQNHIFTTPAGYTRVIRACAEGDPNAAGYIQIEVFTRLVDIAGTYKYSTQGTVAGPGPEGAMLWHLAFQAQATDLQPLDWIYQQAEVPRAARRPPEGGETAPPRIIVPPVTPLSWAPAFPDAVVRVGPRQPSGETAPPSVGDAARLLTWISAAVDPPRRRWIVPAGETAPPINASISVPSMSSWAPSFPDAPARGARRSQGGETAPVAAPAIVPSIGSWAPSSPHIVERAPHRQPAGEVAPAAIVAPPVVPPANSWLQQPVMVPLRAPSVARGEAVGPVLVIPQAPAPPLWSPAFPDFVLARRAVHLGGESSPITAALSLRPALVRLAPIVTVDETEPLIVTVEP